MSSIKVALPGDRMLMAYDRCDPDHPGIGIRIVEPDDESDGRGDVVAIVEYSAIGSVGPGVYIRAYNSNDDEPDYDEPYSLDGNDFEQVFYKLKVTDTPRQAIHIEWDDLSDTLSELLTGLLHRRIKAEALREEYYYWDTHLATPITDKELELLFMAGGANEFDRDENDYGMYPTVELSQGLCSKLINKLLPFKSDCNRADDEGVWFMNLG